MRLFKVDRHERWRERLSTYIDERLEPRERQEVERHLAGCTSCRDDLESLRGAVTLLRRMPQVPVPRSFRLTEAPVESGLPWMTRYAAPFRYATAVAGLLFLGVILGDVLIPTNGVTTPAADSLERGAAPPTAPIPAPAPARAASESATQDLEPPAASSLPAEEAETIEQPPSDLEVDGEGVLSRTLDWLQVGLGALFAALVLLMSAQWWTGRMGWLRR